MKGKKLPVWLHGTFSGALWADISHPQWIEDNLMKELCKLEKIRKETGNPNWPLPIDSNGKQI